MPILDIGAGAASGLETLLARQLAEEKFAQQQKAQEADIDYRNRALTEQSELRKTQQRGIDERANEARRQQEANRISRTVALRPIGSPVTEEEFNAETAAGVPSGVYNVKESPAFVNPQGETAGTVDQGRKVIDFKGTQAQLDNQARIKAAEDRAADMERQRDVANQIAREREDRLREWGPPPVTIGDTSVPGGSRVIRRDQLPSSGAVGVQPAAQRQKIDAYKTTLEMVSDLEKAFPENDPAWSKGLGPIDSTIGAGVYHYTGKEVPGLSGGGARGESLRTKLNRLRAQASFQEGGKQFTGTEAELLSNFLALVEHDPKTAKIRLNEFKKQAQLSLDKLTRGATTEIGGGAGGDNEADPLGLGF